MSSKLTELTESSPSAPPPSVLNGSGILSRFSSPSMASSGHFDPTQTYDGYKEVEVLDPACTECSDELDGEEVEVVPNSAGHPSNTSPSKPPSRRLQSQVIPTTPRTFQPTLATIPPASPHSSHNRPSLNPAVRPSPIVT
ncbi:hypothetical protein O181_106047 [Austropuccinia psidii MF-1]|uniref:Uncharacterized protein n=1 Tax=Austropuccinia psidii MF-1 TaxID=1389203 RepID=A0A9Q3PMY8_9BASI|nr:hypothetical protein [Austropuccinia psidii MF-1]